MEDVHEDLAHWVCDFADRLRRTVTIFAVNF